MEFLYNFLCWYWQDFFMFAMSMAMGVAVAIDVDYMGDSIVDRVFVNIIIFCTGSILWPILIICIYSVKGVVWIIQKRHR